MTEDHDCSELERCPDCDSYQYSELGLHLLDEDDWPVLGESEHLR